MYVVVLRCSGTLVIIKSTFNHNNFIPQLVKNELRKLCPLPYWVVDGWSLKEASLGLNFPNWVKLILNWPASWLAPLTCTSLPPLDMIYIKIWTAANFQLRLTVQPISIQMWAACNDWRVDRRISKKLRTLQIWFHSLLLIPTSCASEERKQNEIFEFSHK